MTHPFEYILERKPWRRRFSRLRDIEYTPYSHVQHVEPFGSYLYITDDEYDHRDLTMERKLWNHRKMYKRYLLFHV